MALTPINCRPGANSSTQSFWQLITQVGAVVSAGYFVEVFPQLIVICWIVWIQTDEAVAYNARQTKPQFGPDRCRSFDAPLRFGQFDCCMRDERVRLSHSCLLLWNFLMVPHVAIVFRQVLSRAGSYNENGGWCCCFCSWIRAGSCTVIKREPAAVL